MTSKIDKARELLKLLEGDKNSAAEIAKRAFLIQEKLSEIKN